MQYNYVNKTKRVLLSQLLQKILSGNTQNIFIKLSLNNTLNFPTMLEIV